MVKKEVTTNYANLNDTIGVEDYMAWRGCGRATADAVFHAKGFPRIPNTGSKLIADKRAVLLYELGLTGENLQIVLTQLARELFEGGKTNEQIL